MALPLRPQGSRVRLLVLSLLAAVTLVGLLRGSGSAGTSARTFAPPVYVDQSLAGGEPEVFADTLHGRLIYSAHEGTTHLYRDGIVNSPWGDFSFVSNYCNQVNIWTSPDGGANWYRDRYLGTTCPTSPPPRSSSRRSSNTATAASASASARCRPAAPRSRRTRGCAERRCTRTGRRSRSTPLAPSTSSGTPTTARPARAGAATAPGRRVRTRS